MVRAHTHTQTHTHTKQKNKKKHKNTQTNTKNQCPLHQLCSKQHQRQVQTYPSIWAHQTIPTSMGNGESSVLEQNLSCRTNAEIRNINIERVFPVLIVVTDRSLRTSELCSLFGGLRCHFFILGFSFGRRFNFKQFFAFLVAKFFTILSMEQLQRQRQP